MITREQFEEIITNIIQSILRVSILVNLNNKNKLLIKLKIFNYIYSKGIANSIFYFNKRYFLQ